MYITQNIAERIKEALKRKQIPIKVMLTDLDMGINTISEFSKGKQLSCISLAKIADYLNVSVDYLLGRNPSDIISPIKKTADDSGMELYEALDDIDRAEIRGEMKNMLKAEKYKQDDAGARMA